MLRHVNKAILDFSLMMLLTIFVLPSEFELLVWLGLVGDIAWYASKTFKEKLYRRICLLSIAPFSGLSWH